MLKKICQCLGLSSLILVIHFGALLGGGSEVRMHVPFSLAAICFAQIADILIVALLLFIPFVFLSRARFYPWVRLALTIVVPLYVIQCTQSYFNFSIIEEQLKIFAIFWIAFVQVLLLRSGKWYVRLVRAGSTLTACLALFALASIAQLLWVATWKPAPNQIDAAWNHSSAVPRQHPLLVWIVFDELSYDQLFEHRAHDLFLPNFDALRAQSTLFTDVQPVGYHTVLVLPSLLTGSTVDDTRFTFRNRLLVHHLEEPGWHSISGADTVFADADRAGWRTAVVGWYNPYCGIYGNVIQNCYWNNRDMLDGVMTPNASLAQNIYTPLRQLVREMRSPSRADRDLCTFEVGQRHVTESDLQQHALQLLHTGQADFVFLHLAIPHSPNTWSRTQNAFTNQCGNSYLDNLALTDHVLGQILAILQSSPRWPQTELIVQGDHSWRTALWSGLPAWTTEDEAASRGTFDPRPALLIHHATQTEPQIISTPWPLIQVHSVAERFLRDQSFIP
jgi:hypothetical protein